MRKLLGMTMVVVCLFSLIGCNPENLLPETPSPEATPTASAEIQAGLAEPPPLIVELLSGEGKVKAVNGTYSWMYLQEDGTDGGINASGGTPHENQSKQDPLMLPVTGEVLTAVLHFEDAPDSVSVRSWNLNDTQSLMVDWESVEVVLSAGEFQIELKDGDYIYEVTAEWNEGGSHWGRAWYDFHTAKQP